MIESPWIGWVAFALVPATAAAGLLFRRFIRGTFALRMRPHFILGYAALLFAILHVVGSMGGMSGANSNGIWFATFATAGLIAQTFSGASLQAPGAYRKPLRRWHLWLFGAIMLFAILHVWLNA